MKDEEMADKYAEEYFGKKTELVEVWKLKSCKDNFLAGLKAGRQDELLTKAKEIIKKMLYEYQRLCLIKKDTIADAEQYIKE